MQPNGLVDLLVDLARKLLPGISAFTTMLTQASLEPAVRLVKSDAAEQVLKARVVAHGIKERMHFEELQRVRLLLVGPLEPDKRFVVVAECQIRKNKGASRNITFLAT